MKQLIIFLLALFCLSLYGCRAPQVKPSETVASPEISSALTAIDEPEVEEDADEFVLLPVDAELPVSTFREVWAYLLDGQEGNLSRNFPITDIGYFGAEINTYGKLVNIPNRAKISTYRGRVHLVVASNGGALTHFSLKEGSPERQQLVTDLLAAVRNYDGLQIDFESVPAQDGPVFLSFLKELRAGLGNKMFTIALPARTRTIANDVYDYTKIKEHVDRILVMAYDEHWSTSAPGPIASMRWCQNVATYALQTVGREKLIMGLPFYGRTWGSVNNNRAFYHSGIERIKREQGITEVSREGGIPTFKYEVPLTITVTAYYEDAYSLSTRLDMYSRMGVNAAGFWCLGQETPQIWSHIVVSP